MLVNFMSDLHLEFGTPKHVYDDLSGDILILAGDIIDSKLRGLETLEYICSKFNTVLMVLGNHEFYSGNFGTTFDKLRKKIPSNIILLDNNYVIIEGIQFIGSTLWSYMNEVDSYFAKVKMNDYRLIRSGPKNEPWKRKLSPSETVAAHLKSALYLEDNVKPGSVVITHHAPSFKSCNPDYDGNTAYATDLSNIMETNKPSIWIHGHMHETFDYTIHDTHVITNPYGYYENSTNNLFELNKTFEVVNI